MDNQEKFEYWLDIAQYDIESARDIINSEQWFYIAVMCQQAIEKLLKGLYIFYKDDNIPRIHNIRLLIQKFESKLNIEINENLYLFFDELSSYYIIWRYPDYNVKISSYIDKNKAQSILTKSEEVFKWLLILKP
jgi:HEPN domain-containing protein